jgi:predicted DsbA family dithiol-disulfide isomerase/uncharacterized membrane protein
VTRRIFAIAAALAGLAASAALVVDALGPAPTYCAADGCEAVRASGWARPLGIPLPLVGVAFFGLALGLAASSAQRARRIVAAVGGAGGLGLLALQGLVIGAWCTLCLVADLAALAHAAIVLTGAWSRASARGLAATAAAGALALTPIAALRGDEPPAARVASGLPEVIAREQRPDVVTIVDFVDFECPFCRRFHARLLAAIERSPRPVRVVRKMMPLDIHAGAMAAAVAWCCADAQGRGDAMAEALLAAPPSQLTPEGCERIAAQVGCDLARYRRDAADPAIHARIAADLDDARALGIRALPTIYIGERVFVGAGASVDELVAALGA